VDQAGNNVMHSLFLKPKTDSRYLFLKLLIEEDVGDVTSPNLLGYKPTDFDHCLSIHSIP
jgi:hypothetical protein